MTPFHPVRISLAAAGLWLAAASFAYESDLPVRPVIAALVNAASFAPGPIAPGEVVTLFGDGLGPDTPVSFSVGAGGRVGETLGGITIRFNDVAGPLLYVSRTQATVIVPGEIRPGDPVVVHVENRGVASLPLSTRAAAARPALFTMSQTGTGQAAVLNQDYSVNSPSNPAEPGTVVSLYISGGGLTDPQVADGVVAGGTLPAANRAAATVGGLPAEVLYAGAAPGLIATVFQANIRIPENVPAGDDVLVQLSAGGAASQTGTTISVRGTGLPPAPQLEVSGSPAGVELRWNAAPAEGILRAQVERRGAGDQGWVRIAAVQSGAFSDPEVQPGESYEYRVRYESRGGYSRYSAPVRVTSNTTLMPARDLKAVATSPARVYLSWKAPGQNAASLRIERKAEGGEWATAGETGPSTTVWRDSGLSAGTAYLYRVRAEAASGASAYTREAAVATPPSDPLPDLAPRVHPADPHRFSIGGATWYPVGYYPAVDSLIAVQQDPYYIKLIDRLSAAGINYFRTVFTMGQPQAGAPDLYQRTGPGEAFDGRPRFDLTKFNQEYFDRWRQMVTYARSKGIVVQLCIMDGWHWNALERSDFPGWGLRFDFYFGSNNINGVSVTRQADMLNTSHPVHAWQQALVRKVVDTLGDLPNIVWEIGNETSRIDWEMRLADVVNEQERTRGFYRHLVMPRDLPGHQFVPGHCQNNAEIVRPALARAFPQNLILITDNDCIPAETPDVRRRKAWAALTSGAHIDFFHYYASDPAVLQAEDTLLGIRYIGYLGRFLSEFAIDLAGMAPLPDAGDGWAFGRPGEEYIVYLRAGGRADLTALGPPRRASWFNPRDGSTRDASGGPVFTAPDSQDWVLYAIR